MPIELTKNERTKLADYLTDLSRHYRIQVQPLRDSGNERGAKETEMLATSAAALAGKIRAGD